MQSRRSYLMGMAVLAALAMTATIPAKAQSTMDQIKKRCVLIVGSKAD
jgi:hypothetical protein